MYPDDQFSTTSSQWTTTYRKLPKKQPFAIKFLSWAAGAPHGATVMKKRTRDYPDDRSQRSGGSSRSYFYEQDTQLYWVAVPDARSYSSGSSTTSRRSKKSSGGSRKHFEGQPMPRQPPPPPGMGFGGPVNGHFSPPPPMQGPPMPMPMPMPMDDGMGMMDDGMHMDGGYHNMAPPPPPPPMNAPPASGGAPAFFDVTGQNQPGNPFQGGGGGGYNSGSEYYTDSGSEYDEASVYSGHY